MEEVAARDGYRSIKDPDMEGLGTGGKLGLFRSPEPNGEAAPAIFGVFPFAHHPHLPVILQNPAMQASAATHSLTNEERQDDFLP